MGGSLQALRTAAGCHTLSRLQATFWAHCNLVRATRQATPSASTVPQRNNNLCQEAWVPVNEPCICWKMDEEHSKQESWMGTDCSNSRPTLMQPCLDLQTEDAGLRWRCKGGGAQSRTSLQPWNRQCSKGQGTARAGRQSLWAWHLQQWAKKVDLSTNGTAVTQVRGGAWEEKG